MSEFELHAWTLSAFAAGLDVPAGDGQAAVGPGARLRPHRMASGVSIRLEDTAPHLPGMALSHPLDLDGTLYPAGAVLVADCFLKTDETPARVLAVATLRLPGRDTGQGERLVLAGRPLGGDRQTGARLALLPQTSERSPNGLVRGTLIETPHGAIAVEDLDEGDEVLTRDGSLQLITQVGRRRHSALELVLSPHLRPLRIGAGALTGGRPGQDLLVSQDLHLVVDDWRAAYLFGEDEILVPANSLMNGQNVYVECPLAGVEYFELALAENTLVCANGLWAGAQLDGAVADASGMPPMPTLPHRSTAILAA